MESWVAEVPPLNEHLGEVLSGGCTRRCTVDCVLRGVWPLNVLQHHPKSVLQRALLEGTREVLRLPLVDRLHNYKEKGELGIK